MLWFKKRKHEEDDEVATGGSENTITIRSVVYDEHKPLPAFDHDPEVEYRIPTSAGNMKWRTRDWNNRVKTSQYTWWNLVPLNLFQQAIVPANFYFIIMSIMQLIPIISDSNGIPTYLLPLAFVMAVTMIKDGWEDVKRHRQDKEQNYKDTKVLAASGEWLTTKWENIKVGDIVQVDADQIIPADLVLLTCSDEYGIAYVNTVQLDGETNMKTKTSVPSLHETYGRHIPDMARAKLPFHTVELSYGPPTSKLYNFNGVLKIKQHDYDFSNDNQKLKASLQKRRSIFGNDPQSQSVPTVTEILAPSVSSIVVKATSDRTEPLDGEEFGISLNQFLWRGATLVNTTWAAGLVVNTGHHTRIYKNTRERRPKTSGLLKSYNIDAVVLFLAELLLCLIAAAMYTIDIVKKQSKMWYLVPGTVTELSNTIEGNLAAFAVAFGRYALLLSYFIPITLFVQVEIARWFESFFIRSDDRAASTMASTTPIYPNVSTMGVLEDLGNVTHVFSDKTGTLTQNLMQLRACKIGPLLFDHHPGDDDSNSLGVPGKVDRDAERIEIAYADRLRSIVDRTSASKGHAAQTDVVLNPNPYVFFDAARVRQAVLANDSAREAARAFFLILSLCHSVLPKVETMSTRPTSPTSSPGNSRSHSSNGSMRLPDNSPTSPHSLGAHAARPEPVGSRANSGPANSDLLAPTPYTTEVKDVASVESSMNFDDTSYHGASPLVSPGPIDFHHSSRRINSYEVNCRSSPRGDIQKIQTASGPISSQDNYITFEKFQWSNQDKSISSDEEDRESPRWHESATPRSRSSQNNKADAKLAFRSRSSQLLSPRRSTTPLHFGSSKTLDQSYSLSNVEMSNSRMNYNDAPSSKFLELMNSSRTPVHSSPLVSSNFFVVSESVYPPAETRQRKPLRLRDIRDVRVNPASANRQVIKQQAMGYHGAVNPVEDDDSYVELVHMAWPLNNDVPYDASSPDELALVSAAKHLGIEFVRRPNLNSIQVAILNKNAERIILGDKASAASPPLIDDKSVPALTFEMHEMLDFDNFRKRMSVIITDQDGRAKLLCKGADSSMLKAAAPNQEALISDMSKSLSEFAQEGLRTLVFGYRVLEASELKQFQTQLQELRASGSDDTETYAALYETVERDLLLVGCTAIDDRLQDEVPETIEALKDAGIHLWVLTGDKVETAISIGYSCNLLCEDTYNAIIDGDSKEKVQQQMYEYMAFVVAGQLAKESFDRILTQLETESPIDSTHYQDNSDNEGRLNNCMSNCVRVTCCRGRRGGGRRGRETASKKRKVNETMNVQDFIKVVSFNARHTKVVAPVDGRAEPKALSADEVERLIQLYVGAFEQHEEKGPFTKLGEMIVPKRTQTSPQATRMSKLVDTETTQTIAGAVSAPNKEGAIEGLQINAPGDVERFKSVAITVTGDALTHCLSDAETKRYFFGLAHLCSTVIACRVTPKQKAEVVKQCGEITPATNFTSLAVGDGANDVGMILTANIGVGIYGKEGSQAACSADVAIGEFKILRNLLFVHGHQILRRHSTMMYQTIFKNVVFAICCFITGWFCGYSAADPYDPYMKQLFNLLYTPWCIMSAAVFDRHLPYELLSRCGSLYPINSNPNGDLYYGFKKFCSWFFYALASGLVICLIPWGALSSSPSLVESGLEYVDWSVYGQMIFILVVLVAILCTVPFTCTVYWFTILAWVLSIGSIYLSWFVLAQLQSSKLYKSWSGQWGGIRDGVYWSAAMYHMVLFCTLILPVGCLFCYWRYRVLFQPPPNVVVRERLKKGVFDVIVAPSRRGQYQTVVVPRTQTQVWKGFAYTPSDTRYSLQRRSFSSRSFNPDGGPDQRAGNHNHGAQKLASVVEGDFETPGALSKYGGLVEDSSFADLK